SAEIEPILPLGTRRQVTRLAVKTLQPNLDAPLPLPENAPYGAVVVDKDACTLCLSCASLCPAGALGDNPDMPQLRFQEDACLQCGLCTRVCPENAISLLPQFDTSSVALSQKVVHEEEPYPCVECGKPFGVKSTIERIIDKLEGKHAMFATSDAARMIRMCDDCRVNAQFHQQDNPFAAADRPQVRTTEDYFSKRRDH
ncbi:MAG: 4Fe-4S dicluster domain-containing protein, partial [Shimia sp.]|nr:4Fe-4S dicluster domain-containing protein [Shimia sp.]